MAKKASFGLGTVVGAVAGVIAGAVGVFLSDEGNRKKVVTEARKVERVVERDLRSARTKVKRVVRKAEKTVAKRKTSKRRK